MATPKRILVCPLDWGLGHATRCIPIIRQLISLGATVIIAADKRPLALLQQEFPHLQFIVLPGYELRYPAKGAMTVKMFFNLPQLIKGILAEQRALRQLIKQHGIDAIISDNRFGLWSREVPCVFITHQVCIKAPIGERFLHWLNLKLINRYSACWIPDTVTSTLSGELSNKLPNNSLFIGHLSRFNKPVSSVKPNTEILAIVSGPEPQRSLFEQLLLAQLTPLNVNVLLVQGLPGQEKPAVKAYTKYIATISHLQQHEMETAIKNASVIISRSGYSTIMDLAVLGKKAILIPTPGQTEQEYLAHYFMQQKMALAQPQNKLNLEVALREINAYKGFETDSNELYKPIVEKWLNTLNKPESGKL